MEDFLKGGASCNLCASFDSCGKSDFAARLEGPILSGEVLSVFVAMFFAGRPLTMTPAAPWSRYDDSFPIPPGCGFSPEKPWARSCGVRLGSTRDGSMVSVNRDVA